MSSKPIKYTLIFNRKNKLNATGEALLQIELYKDAKRHYISTGYHLKPEHWSHEKERVVKRNDSHIINNRIAEIIRNLQDIEVENSRRHPDFNIEDLKKIIKKDDETDFIQFAIEYLKKEKSLSKSTYTKYLNSINSFKNFVAGGIRFDNLTHSVADNFRLHLTEKKIGNNTQKIYFRHLNKYAKLAVKHGYMQFHKNPFPDIRISVEKPQRSIITESEFKRIEQLKFTKATIHLEVIRDLFLIQCYTGLRFSDASRLNKQHIIKVDEGYEIRMRSIKENKLVELPLYLLFPTKEGARTKPELLIDKYMRDDDKPFFLSANAYQSKAANNQYTNRELKQIQQLAKVHTNLTNHIGRHTFATFLVWRLPLPIVQELLQHSKIETTMIYVHVGNDRVKEQLKRVSDWI